VCSSAEKEAVENLVWYGVVMALMVMVAGLVTRRITLTLNMQPTPRSGWIKTYYVVIPSTEYGVLLIMITDDSVLGAS
jgi:hypothetical protein